MWLQKISTSPPQRVTGNSEGGREGVLKAKIFKGKHEPKLEFPEGWGGGPNPKKPSVGGVWIFSGTTQWEKHMDDSHLILSVQGIFQQRTCLACVHSILESSSDESSNFCYTDKNSSCFPLFASSSPSVLYHFCCISSCQNLYFIIYCLFFSSFSNLCHLEQLQLS